MPVCQFTLSHLGVHPGGSATRCARTVPKSYSFLLLGLAVSEKQTPQVVEMIEKPQEQMEGLE